MSGGRVHDASVLGIVGFGRVKGLKTRSGKSVRGAPDEPEARLGIVDGGNIGVIVTKADNIKGRPSAVVVPADTEDLRIVKGVYPEPIANRGYPQF